MRISKALEFVGMIYLPGAAAYYAKQTPDPWQEAHDTLERALLTGDRLIEEAVCERFVARVRELIEQYRPHANPRGAISPADAFAIGDEARVRRYLSVKHKTCVKCDGTERLKIRSFGADSVEVELICANCEAVHGGRDGVARAI